MAMSSSSGSGVRAEPNVTPMIDVMLVLLIIFMIVVPALNAGFNAVPPEGQNITSHPEDDTDQVLGIDANGRSTEGARHQKTSWITSHNSPTCQQSTHESCLANLVTSYEYRHVK